MVSPSSRRRAAKGVVEEGLGNAAQACRALGLARSSYYLSPSQRSSREQLQGKIVGLKEQYPRYGYRRITALLRRGGERLNPKQVQRVRRQAGLQVRKRQPAKAAPDQTYSSSSYSTALIRISGVPLYISIRPVILTCLPSIPIASVICSPALPAGSSR